MGKFAVIEGLDGSGKATQTALLAAALEEKGYQVRALSFPDYEDPSSMLVRMYLAGEFGQDPDDVNAYAASAFYAVDRYASYQRKWRAYYEGDGLLLANRYTTANAIHQCVKLPQAQWQEYCEWLFSFEYDKLGLPVPDLVFLLDVDPAVSQQLMTQRYGGEGKRDIHEQNRAYLERCQQAAYWCAQHMGWKRIACTQNGVIRPREEIAKEIKQIVCEELL